MKRTVWFFVAVLLVVMAAPPPLGAAEAHGKVGAIKAETPQALLAVYHRALAQKDWRSCFLCYDAKMRGTYLREMLFVQGMSKDVELAAIVKRRLQIDSAQPDATFPKVRQDDRVPDEILIYEALQKRADDLPGFADEFCRRLDAMGQGMLFVPGEVREIKVQRDTAVGYLPPSPVTPIAPAKGFRDGKAVAVGQLAPPPCCAPPGQPMVVGVPGPSPEPEFRQSVHFRRIDGNWYFTYPDPPPPLSPAERAKQLRTEVQSLWIVLCCSSTAVILEARDGVSPPHVLTGKSYCEVRLSVQPFVYTSNKPDLRLVRLTDSQAKRLIDHLAAEGFLRQAVELGKQKIPQRDLSENCYTLQVSTEKLQLHEDFGWGPAMLKRLEGLRTALEGDGAEAMDTLLAKLTEDRKKWKMEATNPLEQQPSHIESKAGQ